MPTSNNPLTCTAARHGTASAYNYSGCRCHQGREAWRIYNKRRREGRLPPSYVNPTGTRRRIEALTAIGWPMSHLAARLGLTRNGLYQLHIAAQLQHRSADTIAKLYRELSMTPGPSNRARNHAHTKGWAPPLAWDDDTIDNPTAKPTGVERSPRWRPAVDQVAVERLIAGKPVRHTLHERRAAIHRLTANGHTADDIAARLNVAERTVVRNRHKLRHTEAA